mmetsp:Transcript_24531/g.92675  ORF Transcript_24531/g.92675 Transcript_24531/m.92675 type:complete len:200 (+) Transcript_24531:767-1366(+)
MAPGSKSVSVRPCPSPSASAVLRGMATPAATVPAATSPAVTVVDTSASARPDRTAPCIEAARRASWPSRTASAVAELRPPTTDAKSPPSGERRPSSSWPPQEPVLSPAAGSGPVARGASPLSAASPSWAVPAPPRAACGVAAAPGVSRAGGPWKSATAASSPSAAVVCNVCRPSTAMRLARRSASRSASSAPRAPCWWE